jgi:hypothetical protein
MARYETCGSVAFFCLKRTDRTSCVTLVQSCLATASSDPAQRSHEIESPPVPEYDTDELTAVDEALVTAMERAHTAEEDTLAHLLRCEVGSLRYKDTLGV